MFCNYWEKNSNKTYTKTSYQIQFVWYFHFQILVLKQTTKYIFIFIFKNGIWKLRYQIMMSRYDLISERISLSYIRPHNDKVYINLF